MRKLTPTDPETRSADQVAENIERLKALFPELVTEGSDGVAINVDALKSLVGDNTVTDCDEKYGLNWHGKRQARQLALIPSAGTLRPCPEDSVDWDRTRNLVIEGDNLEVLKLLQKSYAGKVKLIYIDPPYNTGKDFVYADNFQDSIRNYLEMTGQADGMVKISSNTETSGRYHTDWLNMVLPRIKLARELLHTRGALLVSIDDIEVARLRLVLDEVFGEENFLAQFSWRTDGNFDNQAKVKACHEYVLLYARSALDFPHPPVVDPTTPAESKLFLAEIRNTVVKNGPKNPVSVLNLPEGFPADFDRGRIPRRDSPWPRYLDNAVIEDGKLVGPVSVESGWSSKDLVSQFIANDCKPVCDAKGQTTTFVISKTGAIEVVKRRSEYQSHVVSVLAGFGGPQKASAQLTEIGAHFSGYPKPLDLIRYFVQMAFDKDAIVLDFFAGSGTTGHAVMAQNEKDDGERRYILVQLPERLDPENVEQKAAAEFCDGIGKPRNIAELTKERLRRAAKSIEGQNPMFAGDLGFRVFKLESSNLHTWDPDKYDLDRTLLDSIEHLKPGRTEADVLYELLLKLGLDLCVPIEKRTLAGKEVHAVGGGVLMACLSNMIGRDDVEALALGIVEWHKVLAPAGGITCIFRDSAFADDVAKTNMAAILEQHGIANVRSL